MFSSLFFLFIGLMEQPVSLPPHPSCPESLVKAESSFTLLKNITLSACLNGCAYAKKDDLGLATQCLQDIIGPALNISLDYEKKKCMNKKCEGKKGKCIANGKPKPPGYTKSGWCSKKAKCGCYIPEPPLKPVKPCTKDPVCKKKQGKCYKRGSEPEGLTDIGKCGKKCKGGRCFVNKSGE